jgi:DDE superfamily endonuclease
MLLWCDNCGSHKTSCVVDVIRETNIDVAFLPPNMTSELQVLVLVVNGPSKAHIRAIRANRLYAAFQVYKIARNEDQKLPPSERLNLDFNPPKPTMTEGIQDLL